MRYNAGSEVYSQTLCHGLAKKSRVEVFSRIEDSFSPDYALFSDRDRDIPDIKIHLVNMPRARDGYRHQGVDDQFEKVLKKFRPDIVHIGHLNHLSTSIPLVAKKNSVPVVYTLHDYWIMCPRGQFMQKFPENSHDPGRLWDSCEGQEDRKCAARCYAGYFSGIHEDRGADIAHWENWVAGRMNHIRKVCDAVDLFIAPSRYLYERYRDGFGLSEDKMVCLDYGFDLSRFSRRFRTPGEPFTFGYIGTHIPAKGIHHLLEAFGKLSGSSALRIWGRPRGQDTRTLKDIANRLPGGAGTRVEWLSEYKNQRIVADVFNHVDAIVVPSIWVENSPLVIHEALQARVPVITANAGGMSEYIHHEKNGLLFEFRSPDMMAAQMQRLAGDPSLADRLGKRGCLRSRDGNIPDIDAHVSAVERLYRQVLSKGGESYKKRGPWRVTFDTNPDSCNLSCVMCEEHSPYSPRRIERRKSRVPKRIMPFGFIEKTVAEAAAMGLREIIPSTMGEPLLYRHFDGIIDLCRQYGLTLNLTTNGSFPGRPVEEWAKRIAPVCSDIKISWNGSRKEIQESIMPPSDLCEMTENLKRFLDVREKTFEMTGHYCRVTLQMTFMESNLDDLPGMVNMAIDFGVDRLKGHHLWAHFPEIKRLSLRKDSESTKRWNSMLGVVRDIVRNRPLPNGRVLLLENFHRLDPDRPEELLKDGICPFLGKEAWISPEGRFDPCCAPDAQRKSLGFFGSVRNASFSDLWNGAEYRDLLKNYHENPLCLSCNMKKKMEA